MRTMLTARFLRIGHAGAGEFAPPNTLRSIELALQLGVDMVEFDVRSCRDALVLHHDARLGHSRRRLQDHALDELATLDAGEGERIPTLDEAISLIKGRALINVDLKEEGCEGQVVDSLQKHAMLGDVLISSSAPSTLRAIKALAPDIPAGLSYPTDDTGVSAKPYAAPVVEVALWLIRLSMPRRIARKIAGARADAAMLHYRVITPHLVAVAHAAGYRVFAWTVNELSTMRELRAMGVDGIASNRPDLFAQLR
jgi:glycerophosphoryl diester phosphodiesterase